MSPIIYKLLNISKGVHVGCSTGLCSTIQIKEKLFDNLQNLGCSTRIMFDGRLTIVEQKLIELNQGDEYVRLIIISTFIIKHNISQRVRERNF